MKYIKWIALSVSVLILLTFVGAILALNSDSVHRNVEAKISAASGFDVHLGRFGWAFPLRLSVGPSTLKNAGVEVEWARASFILTRFLPPFGVDLAMEHPRVTLLEGTAAEPPPKPIPTAEAAPEKAGGPPAIPPLRLGLRVHDGEVITSAANVTQLEFKFFQASLMQSPASVDVDALVKAGPLPAPVPLHLDTDSLTFTTTTVAAKEVNARIAGLIARVGGQSDLTAERHQWELHVDAPNLKDVPVPAGDVRAWTGAVKAEVKVDKNKLALDADGFLNVTEVVATLASRRAGAELEGPLRANVDAQFGFHKNTLNLPKAVGGVDLGAVKVTYGEAFKKAKDVPLSAAFEVKGTDRELVVSRLDARIGELRLTGGGKAATAAPFNGRVDLNVAPVELEALRPLLPALAKVPGQGKLAFKGALEAPLATTNKVRVAIDRAAFDGPLGALSVSGKVFEVTSPKGPRLDLVANAAPLKLDGVRAVLPALKDLVPAGEVRAKVTLNGGVALNKPWPEWPLDVGGDVSANIPEYKVADAPAAPAGKAAPAKGDGAAKDAAVNAGFLPKGYLTEHLKLKLAATLAKVRKGALLVQGVSGRGEIAGAHFRGDANVAQIFGGKVGASRLDVPLVEVRPALAGEVTWSTLTIEQAVAFAKPEFKDFANGQTAGHAKFKTKLPDDPDFMKALEASGQATAQPVTLNSVKVGEIINTSLGKIPGVSIPPVKVAPLHGLVSIDFNVKNGTADLPSVLARDVDNSELVAKGRVRLNDLNGDLSGTFAWAGSPIKGCAAEANGDGKGRIVIPLAIKGDLMHPGFSVVGDLLTKFGAKTAECEGKKLLQKASKDGLDGLKKEGGKLLKGLFGK